MNLTKIFLTFGDINWDTQIETFLKEACTVYTVDASEPWSKPNRKLHKSVFHERGKPKYLEKNLSEQGGEQKTKRSQSNGITTRIQTLVEGRCSHCCPDDAELLKSIDHKVNRRVKEALPSIQIGLIL